MAGKRSVQSGLRMPMEKSEKIAGWLWLPIHIFGLKYFLSWLFGLLGKHADIWLTNPQANLVYYLISFLFLVIFLFRFLRRSFSDLCDNVGNSFLGIAVGFFIHYVGGVIANLILMAFTGELLNPNSQAILQQTQLNPGVMKAVAIFLAPVAEEILFRGVAFGTVRKKSRTWAYIVSVFLFAVYHLWQYMAIDFSLINILYILQYVPGGLALAWCYEKGNNIWAPIFLHMVINLISISVSIMI